MLLPMALFSFLANSFAFLDVMPEPVRRLEKSKLKPVARFVQKMSNQSQVPWSLRV
jgi:hypothetical protein